MGSRAEISGLFANPGEKALHVGMRGERFEGVIFAFQSFFAEQCVKMIVAGAAEPRDAVFHFFSFELAFVAFVRVPRARNEVVARQQ